MFTRQAALCVVVNLIVAGGVKAQAVNLTEAPLADRCVRNELTMSLTGKITVNQDGKEVVYPHKAEAKHDYVERFLDINGAVSDKAARIYTTAESTITFDNDKNPPKRTLREARRFMVAHRHNDQIVSYSPNGALTRDEVDLTEHFDTQAISGLLPGKQIEVGKNWPIANNVVAALCDFRLAKHTFEGKLEAVKENIAHISIAGTAEGINLGASVKVLVHARLEFDTREQRIVGLVWEETDARQQGPITPALSADVVIKLKRAPIDVPGDLNNIIIGARVPNGRTPPSELTNIQHSDKRYALNYPRNWHITSPDGAPQLVMRYLERGQFIGQATIMPLKKIDVKNVMALEQFAAEMRATPGWIEREENQREKLPDGPRGQHTVYKVAASGELDGRAVTQIFYLIVGTGGDQVSVTFSIDPQHVGDLGARDLQLVREIVFPEAPGASK